MDHVVSRCSKLAQKEYQKRHEKLDKIVYWKLVKKHNFVDKKKRSMSAKLKVFLRMKIIMKIIRSCRILLFRVTS